MIRLVVVKVLGIIIAAFLKVLVGFFFLIRFVLHKIFKIIRGTFRFIQNRIILQIIQFFAKRKSKKRKNKKKKEYSKIKKQNTVSNVIAHFLQSLVKKNREKYLLSKKNDSKKVTYAIVRVVYHICYFLLYYFFKFLLRLGRCVKRIFLKLFYKTKSIHYKVNLFFQVITKKTYWKSRSLYTRIYWKTHRIFVKIYWKIHHNYWNLRIFFKNKYLRLSRHPYLDLLFICIRSILKNEQKSIVFFHIDSIACYTKNRKNCTYRVIEEPKERTVSKPVFFEVCESMSEQYLSPEVYIAEITDAKLVGATSLLIAGNKFLNDMVYYDDEERIDIRYQAVKKVINKIAIVEQVKYKKKFDTAINLIAVASFNYYHLLFETLSKLTFVDAISEYREIPILVDEVVMRIPQYRAALQSINKYQHPICVLGKEEGCIVERLIHPSSNVWMPINVYHRSLIKPSDFIVSDKVIKNLRDSVELCDHRKPWRKIFISRKNTQAIRLKNEAEVKELFTKNGFETVFTEELSFQQQIQIFGQASVVIATSGAALTNILFCQPGTIIGCIIPETHKFYMYSTIAYLLHMRAIFINAEVVERTLYPAADTFEVDLDYAKRYLQWINAEVFEKGA